MRAAALNYKDLVLIYDLKTRKLKTQIKIEGPLRHGVDFSPRGGLLVCSIERSLGWKTNCEIALLDPDAEEPLVRFPAHAESLSALAFLPRGNAIISSARDGSIRLWAIVDEKAPNRKAGGK